MKKMLTLAVLITAGLLMLGCGQSEQAPSGDEAAPTPVEEITDMDFESGDVEQADEGTEETAEKSAEEATPDSH
jgi:ABC-type glycerol-3-phosphate transport system substrate-binding protein